MNEICDLLFARGYEFLSENDPDSDRLQPRQMTGAVVKGGRMVICWRPSRHLMAGQ